MAYLSALCGKTEEEEGHACPAPGSRIMKNNPLISSSSDPTRFPQNLLFHHRHSLTTPAASRSYD